MRVDYEFTVQFRGVVAGAKKISHRTRMFNIRAEDSHRAVDKARVKVEQDPKLKDLFYPTYQIKGVKE